MYFALSLILVIEYLTRREKTLALSLTLEVAFVCSTTVPFHRGTFPPSPLDPPLFPFPLPLSLHGPQLHLFIPTGMVIPPPPQPKNIVSK